MSAEKIMVIKHGALGDIVQGLDGFASVRGGHPDAEITLLTTSAFRGLAEAMPFFDAVAIDRRAPFWNIAEAVRMYQFFHGGNGEGGGWKRIYDFQSSRRSIRYFNQFIPKSVEFVGIPARASHVLGDMTGVNNRDRMVMTAALGGCPPVATDMDWLGTIGGDWPQHAAVLVPGCSSAKPEKRWPAEHFAALALLLHDAGMTPVLAGTAIDGDAASVIKTLVPSCVDYIGKTNLMELAGLMASAELVVGNDTGPTFLGARIGTPTVMVMSKHTDPSMSAPVGASADWLRGDDITAITPEEVMALAVSRLKR